MLIYMQASAITIGQMVAKSTYGNPLSLEIELYNLVPDDLNNIKFKIIDRKIHKMQGTIEGLISDISVGIFSSGTIGWLTITSPSIINVGNVNLVVEISWPGGRSVRHYDLLLIGKSKKNENNFKEVCTDGGVWKDCVSEDRSYRLRGG
jgi:hypothetical protein